MGLYLSLNLTPTIAMDQWDRFWCDSLQVLQKFPLRLVRPSEYKTSYGFQKVWTDKLTATDENGEYWEFSGDAESLLFCEPVRLYRDIEYYRQKWSRISPENRTPNGDPLWCVAQDYTKVDGVVQLFGVEFFHSQTQGYPYHHAIVTVASLAEHRFPMHALAWGDLRPCGCDNVRQWLSSLFNERILMPICHDADRLWNRIEGACGDIPTTVERFEERFLGTAAQRIHRMLAESRETTMQRLAEGILRFKTITLGLKKLSKAFLEATDDLDMFLDLIALRNSLALSKKEEENNRSIINLEDILEMLAKGFVTYSQWQGEEIRTLRRWIESEGGIIHTINTTIMQMSIPDYFDFYCSEKDLLETFVRREPSKQEKFNQALNDALEANLKTVEMIKDFVQTMKEHAEAQARHSNTIDNGSENDFVRFMNDEVSTQSNLPEPLTEKNVALLGRYFGFHVHQMQEIISGMEDAEYMNDPTGNNQRNSLLGTIRRNDARILEDAMLEIERTDDVKLLKLFAVLSPCLFSDMFRMFASDMFGKEFETIYPALWHLFNKPIWWKTFQEHRNDGVSDDNSEI